MHILAIETTGRLGSAALLNGSGKLLGLETATGPLSHLRELIPLSGRLLDSAGLEKRQLTHIAVSAGPGSFTGVRIGVATARALCQSLALLAVAVPTLTAFLQKPQALSLPADTVACAIINARRGQVYGVVDGYMPPCACMLTDVLEIAQKQIFPHGKKLLFFGDGIDAYPKQIDEALAGCGSYSFADESCRYQDAASVGKLALQMIARGQTVNYAQLEPDYMRQAEAEQKLAAGELPICKGPRQE